MGSSLGSVHARSLISAAQKIPRRANRTLRLWLLSVRYVSCLLCVQLTHGPQILKVEKQGTQVELELSCASKKAVNLRFLFTEDSDAEECRQVD